ncbi:sulfotransferase family protein [Oleiagrimonas soli]|uniref:Sulfotransferase n=1 Tax=Oleiagrimonas soli TaxID=1543381 RepID=A0A099CX07_9GAMM|nr:sulfotransferase [Oleiagrimonas soli]KGI78221.1 hypothetical protein LF63_0107770 [Oleiagrimonas soli]MBB6183316.1 hypothetical protein [Oleiagrimonas soli]
MRRIFVVGCPRSGTTIVQAMLAALPGVMSFGETHYAIRLFGQFDRWLCEDPVAESKWRKRVRLAKRKTHGALQRSLDEAFGTSPAPRLRRYVSGRSYIHAYVRALDASAKARDCSCWVEKTPDHLAYVELLAEQIPDAHFIHVVRRGEDVLASAVDGQMRYSEHEVFSGGIPHWVQRWNRALSVHVRWAGDPRHTVLPYDSLFAASEDVQALLRTLTGVPDHDTSGGDGRNRQHIACLNDEPWKRGSTRGELRAPKRKFERIFGPETRTWIREHLADYEGALERITASQPQHAWLTAAADSTYAAANDQDTTRTG